MSHNIAINKIDPLSRKEVATINEKDRLVISNVAHSIVVDSNYILDFIESQLSEGNSIFNIELKAVGESSSTLAITFTSDVWSRCLLREGTHKWADKLLKKFIDACKQSIETTSARAIRRPKLTMDGTEAIHRVVRLNLIPDLIHQKNREDRINLIKKHIGYVRAVPAKGALCSEPDYSCGSNIHWKISKNCNLYSPGSANCSRSYSNCSTPHGIYASSKCYNENKYTILDDVDTSTWDNVMDYIENCHQERNNEEKKAEDRELCLCFKLKKEHIKFSKTYTLSQPHGGDDDLYTFDITGPCELEYIRDIGSKFDCVPLPYLGSEYNWELCCFKLRDVEKSPVYGKKELADNKLNYIHDALNYLHMSGEECALQVVEKIINMDCYSAIFKLDREVIRFIKSAINYYYQEVGCDVDNYCQDICWDIKLAKNKSNN